MLYASSARIVNKEGYKGVGTNPTIQFRIFGSFGLTWLPRDLLERASDRNCVVEEKTKRRDGEPGNEIPKESSEDRVKRHTKQNVACTHRPFYFPGLFHRMNTIFVLFLRNKIIYTMPS